MSVTPVLYGDTIQYCQYKIVFAKFTDDYSSFRLSFSR